MYIGRSVVIAIKYVVKQLPVPLLTSAAEGSSFKVASARRISCVEKKRVQTYSQHTSCSEELYDLNGCKSDLIPKTDV